MALLGDFGVVVGVVVAFSGLQGDLDEWLCTVISGWWSGFVVAFLRLWAALLSDFGVVVGVSGGRGVDLPDVRRLPHISAVYHGVSRDRRRVLVLSSFILLCPACEGGVKYDPNFIHIIIQIVVIADRSVMLVETMMSEEDHGYACRG